MGELWIRRRLQNSYECDSFKVKLDQSLDKSSIS